MRHLHLETLLFGGRPDDMENGAARCVVHAPPSAGKHHCRLGLALCAAGFALSGLAHAEMPERGLYWSPIRPHQAFYIEHQNNRAVVLSFAYNEQGDAEWFTASGELQVGTTLDIENSDRNLHHFLRAPVVRLNGGPVLGFNDNLPRPVPIPSGEVIGEITVNFEPGGIVDIALDTTLPGGPRRRLEHAHLTRFNFGFGGFGRNHDIPHDRCWPNLEGEWVFIDRAQRSRAPWRFKFTNVLVRAWNHEEQRWMDASQMTCGVTYQPHEVVYRDEVANADLRCALTQGRPPPDFPDQGNACEVIDRSTNQTLFYFFMGGSSIHEERILARYGTPREGVPPPEYAPIVGMRVE